jgi:flavin-binding protein dodecin
LASAAHGCCASSQIAQEQTMTIAKIIEISSESSISFQDAIETGITRAEASLKNVKGAWIAEQKLCITDGRITAYRVMMRVSFVLQ